MIFEAAEWGKPLAAEDERAIHLREVLRLEPGDQLRVGLLGHGGGMARYRGTRTDAAAGGRAAKAGAWLELEWPDPASLEPGEALLPLSLVLGQPRPPVMQRLLKDLAAIGVGRIAVVASELSEKSYMQSRLWQGHPAAASPTGEAAAEPGAWQRQLVAGAMQGGHCFLPRVERHYSVHKALAALGAGAGPGLPPEGRRLVLDLAPGAASLLELCAGISREPGAKAKAEGEPWCLAIGPERGWSAHERQEFALNGFWVVGLGSRILRTETACILGCGMLGLALGGRE